MKNNYEAALEPLAELDVSAYGYELIREIVLPDILGPEHSSMMYWAGKRLARKFPLQSWEEIPAFFEKAGWGTLTNAGSKNKNWNLNWKDRSYPAGSNIRKSLVFSLKPVL